MDETPVKIGVAIGGSKNGTGSGSGSGSGRAGFSSGILSRRSSPLEKLISKVQDYMYLPVPDPWFIALGTVAGNMLSGPPVWIVFIGPSSSGKTVKLEALDGLKSSGRGLPGVKIVGGMKSPAALLSGSSKKDMSSSSTGGILKELGSRGVMVMKDFSTMLALNKDAMADTIDALRQTFDGRYQRPVGSDGGRQLEWRGRIGFMAASTPKIDKFSKVIGELGERWMYYRYNDTDSFGETITALGQGNMEKMQDELRELVVEFFEASHITWNEPRRELTDNEKRRLYAMAALVVSARSPVERDPYMNHEIVGVVHKEGAPRLAIQLGQLYLGLERIGIEEGERWRLVSRVGMDSIQETRMVVIQALMGRSVGLKLAEIRDKVRLGSIYTQMTLEDLVLHGVVEVKKKRSWTSSGGGVESNSYKLTDWAREHISIGWG